MARVAPRGTDRSDLLVKLASTVHCSRVISLSNCTGFREYTINLTDCSDVVKYTITCLNEIAVKKTATCSSTVKVFIIK